ncbi:MAG: glycine cleavage system protein [Candidatus Cloacimonadota bacterium]|nr:glycine cleavage system protein [Candidatus Cloacimonadota bacterium]
MHNFKNISEAIMVKEDLYYTESHEWVRVEGNDAYIGITDYAQHELGDIVFVELPEVGDELESGETLGSIEAVKAVEDIVSPISGEVLEINEALEDKPEIINQDAYDDGWLVKMTISDKDELENLLDAQAYKELIEE